MIKSLSISGHRLSKLNTIVDNVEYDNHHYDEELKKVLFNLISTILYVRIAWYMDKGFQKFYVGMADGIDLWAAAALVEYKLIEPDSIKLIAVRPFAGHGNNFSLQDKEIYDKILENADEIVCLNTKSSRDAYLERNRYMINHSTQLLALVADYKSGTGYTINYAKHLDKPVEILDLNQLIPEYLETKIKHVPYYKVAKFL